MSISLMSIAWKSNMAAGRKMVLLALCDNANDQGECYPSISMLSEKCSMSERSIFNHISDLEKLGAVVRENRAGRSTIYHLDSCKFCTPATQATPANSAPHPCNDFTTANSAPLQPLHPTPATVAPTPLQPLHPTPATVAPITINEPSIEPSINQIKKKKADGFVLPDWINPVHWRAWRSHKNLKNATDDQKNIAVQKLAKWRDEGLDFAGALENAAASGYQGLFLPEKSARSIPVKASPGKHAGFQNLDYTTGINQDGSFA